MKRIGIATAAAALALVLVLALAVFATELPGHDDLPTAIGKTDAVVEAWIKEAKASSKTYGPNTLEVVAEVKEAVAGEKLEGEIRGKYEEFHAAPPADPKLNVSYANYTGSGQELRTVANDRVLLLLAGAAKGAEPRTIVRIEPVEKKQQVRDLFAKKDKKPK